MKLAAFISAVLVAVTFGCYLPFNNPSFLPNETHSSYAIAEAVIQQDMKGGKGWMEVVKALDNPMSPWSRPADETETVIPYCFSNAESEKALKSHMEAAIKLWHDRIGEPGPQAQHSLRVKESISKDPQQPYCSFQGLSNNPYNGLWSYMHPDGTLEIKLGPKGVDAVATLGWIDHSPYAQRHYLEIAADEDEDDIPLTMAHELGHVFGLYHEHQRPDRDHYYHFDCSMLNGYAEIRRKVEETGLHDMARVCDSQTLAVFYGWDANLWSKEVEHRNGRPLIDTHSNALDYDSIMGYDSAQGLDIDAPLDKWHAPLVAWTKGYQQTPPTVRTDDNCAQIWPKESVSEGDYAGIRFIYPWKNGLGVPPS